MATATRTRRRPVTRVDLREDFHRGAGSPLKVDRDKGIIHRIKILGWESANGRRYQPEAAKAALRLYEGAKCYTNHPDGKATQMRVTDDALGVWRNPDWQPDGVYADLHYLKTHSLAESICEDAERGLGVFGASHNADGEVERRGGVDVIHKITEVRSVDIVTDPATVSNLWEGRTVKKKLKDVLLSEAVLKALTAGRQKRLRAICEAVGEREMEADDQADHKDHLYNAMRSCEESGDGEMAGKIHKLLAPEKGEVDSEEDDKQEPKPEPKVEGKTASPVGLTEAKAKALCKLAGIEATAEVLEAVVGLPEEKAVAVLTLTRTSAAPVAPQLGVQPRSVGAGTIGVTEGKNGKKLDFGTGDDAGKKRLAFLRG